jgi:hypothetical protein
MWSHAVPTDPSRSRVWYKVNHESPRRHRYGNDSTIQYNTLFSPYSSLYTLLSLPYLPFDLILSILLDWVLGLCWYHILFRSLHLYLYLYLVDLFVDLVIFFVTMHCMFHYSSRPCMRCRFTTCSKVRPVPQDPDSSWFIIDCIHVISYIGMREPCFISKLQSPVDSYNVLFTTTSIQSLPWTLLIQILHCWNVQYYISATLNEKKREGLTIVSPKETLSVSSC